jgi:hypothetical protein
VEGLSCSNPWREGMAFSATGCQGRQPESRQHLFCAPISTPDGVLEIYHFFQLFFTLCESYLELYCNTWEWMSGASRGHAAPSFPSPQPSEMGDATRGPRRRFDEPLPQTSKRGAFRSDDAGIVIRDPGNVKPELDKRSLDYILRSGLAGGLAGCAVWRRPPCPLPSY